MKEEKKSAKSRNCIKFYFPSLIELTSIEKAQKTTTKKQSDDISVWTIGM